MFDGGGRKESEECLDGDQDLVGEAVPETYGIYGGASVVGGGIIGALSSIDGDRDRGREVVDGWYDLWGDTGLRLLEGELRPLRMKRA